MVIRHSSQCSFYFLLMLMYNVNLIVIVLIGGMTEVHILEICLNNMFL